MNTERIQNEIGYFGKLPAFGDFIHQLLPQDFANGFHAWLQNAMAGARAMLGDEFLSCYLNCPAWKFALGAGVCGAQPAVGLTIPSVDRVGRYFNFTLATMLPAGTNPVSYAIANAEGFGALENTALDILESDDPRELLERQLREVTRHFEPDPCARVETDDGASHTAVTLDRPLPFAGQSAALMNVLFERERGGYSVWWSGQQGQDRSRLILCSGMPADDTYLSILFAEDREPAMTSTPDNPVDRIIAGDPLTGDDP